MIYIIQRHKCFVIVFKTIKFVLLSRSLTNSHHEQNTSLLIIIIYKASYKKILFRFAILIQENKHQIFPLSHLMKNYWSIYKYNDLYSDLKSETFAWTQGSLRIQRTTRTYNSITWVDLSGSLYFEMPQNPFLYHQKLSFILYQFSSLKRMVFDPFWVTLVRMILLNFKYALTTTTPI